jgi:putative transposase
MRCVVPKVFPTQSANSKNLKLTPKKLKYLIKKKEEGMLSRTIAEDLKISKRRVNQIWKEYREKGTIPIIGENVGRPADPPLTDHEKEIIRRAKHRYKLGARRLEPLIDREDGIHIPHNRIHRFLLEEGLAHPNERKQRRRRWVRYEREHSLSAGHIDWHDSNDGKAVCAIEDDCSRKILAYGEYSSQDTENSKEVFKRMVDEYWSIYPMRELILDHGSAFGAHRTDEKGDWDGEFKEFIESFGTKPIRIRVNHPQSNGKIEKWFDVYDKYRSEFSTLDEFVHWYNCIRPHESLAPDGLKTPEEAFWERLPEGASGSGGVMEVKE